MSQQIFQTYEKELNSFQEWIQSNPRLPQTINRLLLLRFLKIYDFDLEKAKKLLLFNLEMRQKNPNIFEKRDIASIELQQALQTFHVNDLPRNSPENYKVSIFRLADDNPDKFIFADVVRMASATLDARLVRLDKNELTNGDYLVFDMKGFGFKHLMKCVANLSLLRNYMKYSQEAAPLKMIQNHFINCSPVVSKLMSFIKPFMNKEVTESLQFHTNMETLFEIIPRELLPNELGGSVGNIKAIFDDWLKVLMTRRDYLLNDDQWKLNE